MRRRLMSLILASVLLPLSAGPTLAVVTLDQEALPNGVDNVAYGGIEGYQTFTAGLTGDLVMVSLYVFTLGLGDTWNVAIRAVAAGAPAGPDLATGSVLSTPEGTWTEIPLTPALPVTAGTEYAIVASPPTPFWGGAFPYAGGQSNNPFTGGEDLAFRTYVTQASQPVPSILVESTVALTQAGPFSESLTAPVGSTIWRTISVINSGETRLSGITLEDSGGALPASCPTFRPSLQIGERYTCTFSVPVASGTTVHSTTATSGNLTSTGRAYVTGALSAIGVGSKLGLPASPGAYTTTTKVASLGGYVSWQGDLGPGAAGKPVGVYVSRKGADGSWGAWSRLTSRTADAAGAVSFSRRELQPAWLSVRFSLDGETFTRSTQARWR